MKMLGLNPMEQEIIDLTNNISRNIIVMVNMVIMVIMAIMVIMVIMVIFLAL